jgi:DNA polymerase (family 10)
LDIALAEYSLTKRGTAIAYNLARLLSERPSYPVDVMKGAKERGCILELNAYPVRLHLDDIHCKQSKATGIEVAIPMDAHSTAGLGAMRFGIGQARRGCLEASDILNTRPWPKLRELFAR